MTLLKGTVAYLETETPTDAILFTLQKLYNRLSYHQIDPFKGRCDNIKVRQIMSGNVGVVCESNDGARAIDTSEFEM
jgi:hypothetical protein